MLIDMGGDGGDTVLERAAEQALDLHATVADLSDPKLRELVDVVLMEIGIRLAKQVYESQT